MLLGVFSDVHDNIPNLRNLLALYTARGVSTLVFCGDFCSPIGDCLWLNPGEVLGWNGPATAALYDTERHRVEILTL